MWEDLGVSPPTLAGSLIECVPPHHPPAHFSVCPSLKWGQMDRHRWDTETEVQHAAGEQSNAGSTAVSFSNKISFSVLRVNKSLNSHTHNIKQEVNLQIRLKARRQTRPVAQEICAIHTRKGMPGHIYVLRTVDSPL